MTQGHGRWAHFWPLTTWRTFAIITSVISNGSSLSENYVSGFIEWFSVVIFDGGWWFRWIRLHCTRPTLATAPHVTAPGSEDTEWLEWVSDPKPWPPDLELAAATKCEVKAATSNCLSQVHIWDSSWENLSPAIDHKIPLMWFSCNECEGH